MLTPLALFVALLLATAFIAHWSDNLGKKLGKKRVSVFGLRPRTSATLLTVASSWVIMIFTLAALLAAVAPLRHALFRYDAERARFARDTQEAAEKLRLSQEGTRRADERRAQAQSAATTAQASVAAFRGQAQTARAQAQQSQTEARRFQSAAQQAQSAFQSAQRNLQRAQLGEQVARRGEQNARHGAQVALANEGRARLAAIAARTQEQVAQGALQKAQLALQRTQARLAQGQARLNEANVRLAIVNLKLGSTQAKLEKSYREVAASYREVAQAQKEVNAARAARNSLQKQVKALHDDVGQAQLAATQYGELAEGLAFSDIRVPVDKTLAERRFDATNHPEEIVRQLRILIDAARVAVGDKDGFVPGAKFVVGAPFADPATGRSIELSEDETVQVYARALSSANQTVSARLVSAFNYPATTTVVAARFVFVPIRTIYSARQIITQAPIDARKSESAIFGDLQRLVDDARLSAVKNGASPPLSSEEQNFFDGDTGQKLFDALRQVQKVGHPVTVRVVAARDLDSAEPLQVRFVVGDVA